VEKPFTWEHGPFEDCWRCKGKGTFGILSVGGDAVTKRCTRCRYSHAQALPALDKKVIYLDQFAFSELHKLRTGQRRSDNWTSFWAEANDLLDQALLWQQVILPHSDVHHSETIVSRFAKGLRDTQEQIGGDMEFVDTDEVQLQQIDEFARAFFANDEPVIDFDVDDVLDGNRNDWLPDMRISVGMNWSSFVASTRKGRAASHSGVTSLIEGWRVSGDGFNEVLERELGAYLESRRGAILHSMKLFEEGLAENDLLAILNISHSFVRREMDIVHHYARKAGVPEEGLTSATTSFWNSLRNREQPFGRMLAYVFAALAAQVKGGRKSNPSAGFMNDVRAIAAYAPYVDAMLVDKECAELLRHGRCRAELTYKASIFSLTNAGAFLDYLRRMVECAPADVRRHASLVYGC